MTSRFELIAQNLKKPDALHVVSLKCLDGYIDVLKSILMASGEAFPDSKEIEIKYPAATVQKVVDWMHATPLEYKCVSAEETFDILRFAEDYKIKDLINDISRDISNILDCSTISYNFIKQVLTIYKHDGVGKDIYNKAIKDFIWMRDELYTNTHRECQTSCGKDCESYRKVGPNYLSITKAISQQVQIDIAEYEI